MTKLAKVFRLPLTQSSIMSACQNLRYLRESESTYAHGSAPVRMRRGEGVAKPDLPGASTSCDEQPLSIHTVQIIVAQARPPTPVLLCV